MVIFLLLTFTAIAMLVHELGHLIAARCCKVSVSELGLGIGPRLFSFRIGNLRLSLRAFPIGSVVWLDGNALKKKSISAQLLVHLGGIIFNLIAGILFYRTIFGWLNLLLAAGNILPLYQHDGWKCGVVFMRSLLQRKSQSAEWAFTFSGGFVSLVVVWAVIRIFV